MTATGYNKGEGHRERLREKFLHSGLSGFHDYEVIELLLTLATPRKDCKDAAKSVLKKFKTLQGVLEASANELCEVDGIGPKNLFGIKLIKAVADRYLEKRLLEKDNVSNSKELFDYLYYSMRDKNRECFKVIYLDAKNRVIETETLFKGINCQQCLSKRSCSCCHEPSRCRTDFCSQPPFRRSQPFKRGYIFDTPASFCLPGDGDNRP